MAKKTKRGIFVVADGIDGAGKGTAIGALTQWAEKKSKKILDLKNYWKEKRTFPEPEKIAKYDVLLSGEPTFAFVGQAIREEIARKNGREYSAWSTAQAFSLDREILYRRVLLPALAQGKIIFQERSVTTSLIYQPIQKEPLPLKKIMELPGNKLALTHRPDLLIITLADPEEAIKRLSLRSKKDNAIFEKVAFLKKADKRFSAPWFKKIFEARGSRIVYLKTDKTVEDTISESLKIWEKFLKDKKFN